MAPRKNWEMKSDEQEKKKWRWWCPENEEIIRIVRVLAGRLILSPNNFLRPGWCHLLRRCMK